MAPSCNRSDIIRPMRTPLFALPLLLSACIPDNLESRRPPVTTGVPDAGVELPLGATVTPDGVVFRVWAPHATAAAVEGDFAEETAAMTSEPGGIYSATVASARAGTAYRFAFESPVGSIVRLDPYCRQLQEDSSTCTVVDPSSYTWHAASFVRPAREATVMYELHIGSFAVAAGEDVGTFAEAQTKLVELADLGVNAVELMPVQHFGGAAGGWGYNPNLYFAPKPSYGTADDLRAFVDAAHALGIGVFLDTVVNHYDGWPTAPLFCYDGACDDSYGIYFFPPGPYEATPWGPRPNYTTPQVADMLVASVASWWHGENAGDGLRWDSVSNIRGLDGQGTTPGGRDLLVKANDATHEEGGMSIAEDLKGWDMLTAPASDGGFGFDAQWDGFGWIVEEQLVGESDDARDIGAIEGTLKGSYGGDPFARLIFTEMHDTVGNGGVRLPEAIDPADPTSFAARRRSMLGAVLLMTTPGVPMLFMGQESLALGTFDDPPAPLAGALPPEGAPVRELYKDLIALRRNLGGKTGSLLETGVDILHREDKNKVIAYRRHGASGEDVVVVVNLRHQAYDRYDVGVPDSGTWRIRLDTDWLDYGDDFGGGQKGTVDTLALEKDGLPNTLPVKLGAYGAVVFSR